MRQHQAAARGSKLSVALVQDWLTGMRGGEKCLSAFCELFPDAPVFTLIHKKGTIWKSIEDHRIETSFIEKLPFAFKSHQKYLPLFPAAIERFDLRGFDLVISSSHCVAKGVLTFPGTTHICYCHTPMRYAWDMYWDYFGPERERGIKGKFISVVLSYLRTWDVASSQRVDHFIANSENVKKKIAKYYGRDSEVIHPWVDTETFVENGNPGDYYLIVSALVPYKRIDLAIEATRRLNAPLVIVGNGVERKRLEKQAGPNVKFTGWLDGQTLSKYYSGAKAVILPGEEDFGIVPLEAQSCRRPVVAYGAGGALETVEEGKTGFFFYPHTVESLIEALVKVGKEKLDGDAMRKNALRFTKENFKEKIKASIETKLGERSFG
ncbi:MAG: glycosyltransferase [Candidatus Eisenbacteria bacterium]|nr:glycosyltransferase [Candidatus Eisenbacteria bacterium]